MKFKILSDVTLLFVCLGSFFVYKDSFIIHTPMEMPRNLSRGKRIFARDNNKLSSQVYRSANLHTLRKASSPKRQIVTLSYPV